jgi:hypothetical protein
MPTPTRVVIVAGKIDEPQTGMQKRKCSKPPRNDEAHRAEAVVTVGGRLPNLDIVVPPRPKRPNGEHARWPPDPASMPHFMCSINPSLALVDVGVNSVIFDQEGIPTSPARP